MSNKQNKKPLAAIAVLPLLVALVVYFSLRTIESATLRGTHGTLSAIGYGEPVDDDALKAVIAVRTGAVFFTEPARVKSDFALANIMLAERTSDEVRKQELLNEAVTALKASLKSNPGNPYAWFRLAHARNLVGAAAEDILDPLRMSFMTGPHEPRLVFTRLPLALAYFEQMDDTTRTLLRHQIRFAWKEANRRTAFLSVSFAREDFFLDAIAVTDPEGAERFRRYLSFIERIRNPD